tara:strand:- start:4964 stop:5437 length:474 start_codon:yes stop_codon:yes gene_type:complete
MFRKYKDSQIIGLIVCFVGLLLMAFNVLEISLEPTSLVMFGLLFGLLGYIPNFKSKDNSVIGVAISPSAQKELDYLHEKTGFTAHKVDTDFRFNGHMKTKDNPEAAKIESILFRFASCGYVFTKDNVLLGKISTITSKEERVKIRRSNFEVIDGFKD